MATWGDWIGLSLIDWTAGYALVIGAIAQAMVVAAIAIAAAGTAFFHIRCLYFHHRPDAGYPRHGTASLSGLAHLVYFFLQCVACALALLAALGGTIPSALIATAIAGALVYLASFAADWKAGKLRPEKI